MTKRRRFLGFTRQANRMTTEENTMSVAVMFPLITSGLFYSSYEASPQVTLMSATAAMGRPKLAAGPQKCVERK